MFLLPLEKMPKDIEKYIPLPFRIDKAYVMVKGACKHLVEEGDIAICSIYENRPEVCRAFECDNHYMPTKIGGEINN
jgi:Fe-S-cluster containining protein